MLKLEIKLNEKQILLDNKYDLSTMYDAVDKAFAKYHFVKDVASDGTVIFCGTGLASDYGAFGRLITTLKDKAWFMAYVNKWLWYNSDDGEDEDDFVVEDILYHYTQKESAA